MTAALQIHCFTFNAYQENTYLLWDDSGEAVLIDPGCESAGERRQLADFIQNKGLKPVYLLNTHGHIDHMMGNRWAKDTWGMPFATHRGVLAELEAVPLYSAMMGMHADPSPMPDLYLEAGDSISFGAQRLEVLFTPGHSAGHISFWHAAARQLFSGDVLFAGSIGRTDLPGGDYDTLMQSIFTQLLPLGDEVRVWPGHGPETTLGRERLRNPFLLEWAKN